MLRCAFAKCAKRATLDTILSEIYEFAQELPDPAGALLAFDLLIKAHLYAGAS